MLEDLQNGIQGGWPFLDQGFDLPSRAVVDDDTEDLLFFLVESEEEIQDCQQVRVGRDSGQSNCFLLGCVFLVNVFADQGLENFVLA